jgi:hypothetical protein
MAGRLPTLATDYTPAEVRVLQPIAQGLGCTLHVDAYGASVWFDCATSAGHSAGAWIQRYSSPEAAYAVFTATGTITETFHGYPAESW